MCPHAYMCTSLDTTVYVTIYKHIHLIYIWKLVTTLSVKTEHQQIQIIHILLMKQRETTEKEIDLQG